MSPPPAFANDETSARNSIFSPSLLPGSCSLYSSVRPSETPLATSCSRSAGVTWSTGLSEIMAKSLMERPKRAIEIRDVGAGCGRPHLLRQFVTDLGDVD